MAAIESSIHVSVDTAIHEALEDLVRSTHDNLGVCISEISVDWSAMAAGREPNKMRLNSIEMKTSKVVK